jgi:hypothetical protein
MHSSCLGGRRHCQPHLLNCPITVAEGLSLESGRTKWRPATTLNGVNDDSQSTESVDEANELEMLRDTPVELILGNYIFHLIQLAAVHLASTPANLSQAQLTIDIVAAILKAGDERLGENVALYRSALAEVQQVYVRAAASAGT